MTETILILDSDEQARANTEAQMRQTARRYGIGGTPGLTEVGGAQAPMQPAQPAQAPMQEVFPQAVQLQVTTDHLLLTPSAQPGQVRLVRMQGPRKCGSWTLGAEAASTVAAIVSAFGITLTDLRESEDEPIG